MALIGGVFSHEYLHPSSFVVDERNFSPVINDIHLTNDMGVSSRTKILYTMFYTDTRGSP
jgi:hypothetical protein